MNERLPSTGFGGYLRDNPLGVLAVASVVLLCLLVAVTGTVAIVARTVGTWRSLFLMEQAFALTLPTVKVLMAVSIAASLGFVLRR